MSKTKETTKDIGLGGISIKERLRALRPETVKDLAESMQANGLLQPIVLQPKPGGLGYWLLAGMHRFEAAKKLKWPAIKATILDGLDADQAELAEIDENLMRANLSPAETAAHIGRRKELYENLYPTTKAGIAQGLGMVRAAIKKAGGQIGPEVEASFTEAIAQATGQSRRTVKRNVTRATKSRSWLKNVAWTALDQGDEIDALIKLPEAKRDALIIRAKAGEKVSAKTALKQHSRGEREQELADKIVALPSKKYGVIYADPEWRFEPWSRKTGLDRAADNHYPTSVTDVIAERPVEDIAAKDCVLFLWATAPMLPEAMEVLIAWGFDYKTHMVWRKQRPGKGRGTGYWVTGEHELLLIGTHGRVPAPATAMAPSVLEAPVGKHSEKPELFAELIEKQFPNVPKIELNCRGKPRPGWDAWGNEANDAASIAS